MGDRTRGSEVTKKLAQFVHDLRISDMSEQVISHTARVIRDTLGTMLAGAARPEVRGLAEKANALGGPGRSTLMGRRETTTPHFAALVNGTGAVSLELDEGNQYAINHPAVHIFPAALALAEELKRSGAELLTAFVAGYEVAVRVGRATHLREAVHPFGTHAIIGTAAAASRLLRLDIEEIVQALNLAAGICIASSQTAANAGASVRNLATGLTNQNGLLAPILVRAGFTGEPGSFNVVFGQILGDSFKEKGLGDDLGQEFYITRNYFKLRACSRWNHAPIEAMARLLSRKPFKPEDVERITVWTYDPATRLSWSNPVNGYAGKHSIPYNVAVRLVLGHNDLEAYSEAAVSNPQVQEISRRVTVREDPKLTAMLPDVRPARVQVKLKNGSKLTETVERPPGGFDNPYTEEDLLKKFRRLAGMTLTERAVPDLEKTIERLPDLDDVTRLSSLLQGEGL
jgi:2-methylcitrate dehydratase PrpD